MSRLGQSLRKNEQQKRAARVPLIGTDGANGLIIILPGTEGVGEC